MNYYSLFITVGITTAYFFGKKRADKFNISRHHIDNLIILIIPSSILGARIYHIISEYSYYIQHVNQLFTFKFNGLSFFGAVLGGIIPVYIYCKAKKINLWKIFDIISPTVLLFQVIGRIGNYFNQELYGFPTSLPWGIYISPENRGYIYNSYSKFHPVFAYEMIWNTIGLFLLIYLENNKKYKLSSTVFYLLWYGTGRLFIGFLRNEPDDFWIFNDGQICAIGFILLSILIYRIKIYADKNKK